MQAPATTAHVRELLAGISSNTRMIEQVTTAVELIRQRTARLEEEVFASMPTHPQQLLPAGWQVVKRSAITGYHNGPRVAEWWLQRQITIFTASEPVGPSYTVWQDVSGPFTKRSAAIESYVRMHRGAILAGPMPPDDDDEAAPAEPEPGTPPEDDYDDC